MSKGKPVRELIGGVFIAVIIAVIGFFIFSFYLYDVVLARNARVLDTKQQIKIMLREFDWQAEGLFLNVSKRASNKLFEKQFSWAKTLNQSKELGGGFYLSTFIDCQKDLFFVQKEYRKNINDARKEMRRAKRLARKEAETIYKQALAENSVWQLVWFSHGKSRDVIGYLYDPKTGNVLTKEN